MKKTAIATAVVALAACAYVAASWALGQQIEERYSAEVERALPLLPGMPGVVERSYERGWFTSLATSVVELELPAALFDSHAAPASADDEPAPTRTLRLHLQDRLRHGPLPGARLAAAAVESRLVRVEGVDDALRDAFAKAAAPYLDSVFGFDGGYSGRLVLPAGEFAQGTAHAQWQQLESTFRGDAQGQRVGGELRWPRATLERVAAAGGAGAPALRFVLEGVQGRFDAEQPQPAGAQSWLLAQGAFQATIDSVAITRANDPAGTAAATAPPPLALNAVTIDSKTTRDGELMNSTLSVAAARGSLGGLPIEAIRFETALDRLDADALGTVHALLLEQTLDAEEATAQDGAAQQQGAAALGEAIDRVLAARPGYRMRWNATIAAESGEFGYQLAVRDAAAELPPEGDATPAALLALLGRRVDGAATLRLPKGWLPAIAQAAAVPGLSAPALAGVLSNLVAQKLLVEDPNSYRADLQIAQGTVSVNGKPVSAFAAPSGRR